MGVIDPYDKRNRIVDERCECGELKSKHSKVYPHRCPYKLSECFRWAAFVLDDGTDLSNEVIPW